MAVLLYLIRGYSHPPVPLNLCLTYQYPVTSPFPGSGGRFLFSAFMGAPLLIPHVNENTQYLSFCVWCSSFKIVTCSFPSVWCRWVIPVLLQLNNIPLCIYILDFLYPFCHHVSSIKNVAAGTMSVQIYFSVLVSFPWTVSLVMGIAGSHGSASSGFLRKFFSVPHQGWANFDSLQQCVRVLLSPHSHQNLFLPLFIYFSERYFLFLWSFNFELHFPGEIWY